MFKFEWPIKILWLVLLTLSLIACASAGSDQVNGQVTPGQQAEVTQESIAQSTTESPEETQAVRTALEATDPASVELASGEIQFVEFFAFW